MPTGVIGLAFTPDGTRGVAAYLFDGGVHGLTVAADGSIDTAGSAILTPSVQHVTISPNGRFAYMSTRDFNMVAAVGIIGYSIEADGTLTTLDSSPFSSGQIADLVMTPDGRHLYAIAGGQIRHFSVAGDGALTETGAPTPSGGAASLVVAADGRFLFAGRGGGASGVASYTIAPDGGLTQNGPPALTGDVALRLFAVSPDGRYVYMPDVNVNGIVTAAVGADGSLSVVGTTPVANPESVAVSADSRLLYYARSGVPGLVGVGRIGANGVATLMPATAQWSSGERQQIMFGPQPAPTARFNSIAGAPGATSIFDAGGSAGAVRFDWSFGDGTTLPDGGPTPSHLYAEAGVYEVRLTVTDDQGCSTRFVYTGQSTVCPGGASATATAMLDTPPVLRGLSVTNKRFAAPSARRPRVRRRTVFRYRLSEAARVRITIRRRLTGRRCAGGAGRRRAGTARAGAASASRRSAASPRLAGPAGTAGSSPGGCAAAR